MVDAIRNPQSNLAKVSLLGLEVAQARHRSPKTLSLMTGVPSDSCKYEQVSWIMTAGALTKHEVKVLSDKVTVVGAKRTFLKVGLSSTGSSCPSDIAVTKFNAYGCINIGALSVDFITYSGLQTFINVWAKNLCVQVSGHATILAYSRLLLVAAKSIDDFFRESKGFQSPGRT